MQEGNAFIISLDKVIDIFYCIVDQWSCRNLVMNRFGLVWHFWLNCGPLVVLVKFSSVQFLGIFTWTLNWTLGSGSIGPVLVQKAVECWTEWDKVDYVIKKIEHDFCPWQPQKMSFCSLSWKPIKCAICIANHKTSFLSSHQHQLAAEQKVLAGTTRVHC